MAAVTVTELVYGGQREAKSYCRSSGASAVNTDGVLTTTRGVPFRLKRVHVHYSASPTQAGVVSEVDSGLGANYDHTLDTGTVDDQDTVYIPDGDGAVLGPDDEIRVTALAGGSGIYAYIQVVTEDL